MSTKIDPQDITTQQLTDLRSEAGAAGDSSMVEIIDLAMHGDTVEQAGALVICARVINEARANAAQD